MLRPSSRHTVQLYLATAYGHLRPTVIGPSESVRVSSLPFADSWDSSSRGLIRAKDPRRRDGAAPGWRGPAGDSEARETRVARADGPGRHDGLVSGMARKPREAAGGLAAAETGAGSGFVAGDSDHRPALVRGAWSCDAGGTGCGASCRSQRARLGRWSKKAAECLTRVAADPWRLGREIAGLDSEGGGEAVAGPEPGSAS